MSIDPKGESIEGVFYKINKKIEKKITAKYHKIKDWVMDPKGYFLIAIDKKNNLIRVGYCKFTKLGNDPVNDMVAEIVADMHQQPEHSNSCPIASLEYIRGVSKSIPCSY